MHRRYHQTPLRRPLEVLMGVLMGVMTRHLSAIVGHRKIALVGEDGTFLRFEQVDGPERLGREIIFGLAADTWGRRGAERNPNIGIFMDSFYMQTVDHLRGGPLKKINKKEKTVV